MKTPRSFGLALGSSLASLFVLVACGGPLEPGYTDCADTVCSPGQYCFGPNLCANGCTSNANCQDGSACQDIDDVVGYGTCSETAAPPADPPPSDPPPSDPPPADPVAACKAAVDSFQQCGLPADDAAQWRADCGYLTEDQAIVITNCGEMSCSSQLSCLDVDCFNDSHCGVDESCVGHSCL